MRLWALSPLAFSFGFVVVVAACGSDPPEAPPETAISKLPLSAACSACAQGALGSSCSAELAACANNPSCFDVESCLVACDPNDVACFSECAQASAAFNDLTTCVFCDTCTQECAGEWSCGQQPPPPTDCDNSGSCASCATCATQDTCKDAYEQCSQSSECFALANCAVGCGSDPSCLTECAANASPSAIAEFEELGTCVACNACANDCSAEAQVFGCSGGSSSSGSSGGNSCDNSGSCSSCASCASNGPCIQELGACFQIPECKAVVECAQGCDDVACLDQCVQSSGGSGPELEALLSCTICDQCSSDCDGKALGCP